MNCEFSNNFPFKTYELNLDCLYCAATNISQAYMLLSMLRFYSCQSTLVQNYVFSYLLYCCIKLPTRIRLCPKAFSENSGCVYRCLQNNKKMVWKTVRGLEIPGWRPAGITLLHGQKELLSLGWQSF